jgi:hypothetical protein
VLRTQQAALRRSQKPISPSTYPEPDKFALASWTGTNNLKRSTKRWTQRWLLAASGRYGLDRRLTVHLVQIFDKGERRWLVLANRAIERVEQEFEAERTFIDTSVVAFSREIGKIEQYSPGEVGSAGFDWPQSKFGPEPGAG